MIYEIDARIRQLLENAVDEETGELLIDPAELEALQMERDEEVENLALVYKNLTAEAAAIKAEEDALKKRRESAQNKAERVFEIISGALGGENFKTARVAISHRKSKKVVPAPEFVEWAIKNAPEYLTIKEPTADKRKLGEALKRGENIPFAEIVEAVNMTIK